MVSVRMLDAIYLRQLEFGVDEVDECFVMPQVVGDSGDKWMVLVSLFGGVTFSQPAGTILRDLGRQLGWVYEFQADGRGRVYTRN